MESVDTLLWAPIARTHATLILIVDDDLTSMAVLTALLSQHFDVITTTDPTQAAELARHAQPDVILCDINMPEMNGDEVAFELSTDPDTAAIPVVYLTALLEAHETDQLQDSFGGHWAVSKAAPLAELLRVISRAVK